jgi:tetratricopeptide (TPR) repeat protein
MSALHVGLKRNRLGSLAILLASSLLATACSGPEVAGKKGAADQPAEPAAQEPPAQQGPPAADPNIAQPAGAATTTAKDEPPVAAAPAEPTPTAEAKDATATTKAEEHPADVRYANSPAESLINDGVNLMRDNNLFDARQRLQAATQQDGKSATAWYNLALVQQRMGNPDDAIQSVKKAVELNPTYSKAVVLLTVLYLRKGDGRAALEAVEQGLSRRPGDVMLLGAKARVLVEEKEFQRALDTGILAIKLDQDNPESLRYLAEAYLGLGREGLARLALDRAFQIYTGNAEPPAGAPADASLAGRKAYDVRISRGGGSWRGPGAEALDRDAGVAHIYYLYGQMALKKNDVVEAREHFLQATKLRPSYGEAWNNLGVCWIAAKKGEEAIDALTKALEINPTSFEARLNLGSAYRISKDPQRAEKAKAEYERAQKQDPRHPAPVFNLGILYLESQLTDVTSGEARFQKALEYFAQYRELRGPGSQNQKDPLDDYIAEAKNLLKIEQDKRKVQEKAATEKSADDAKKAEDARKKAEEDARKKAEAEAKKAEEEKAKPPETAPTPPPGDKPPETQPVPPPTEKREETPPPAPPPPPPPSGDKPPEGEKPSGDQPPPPPPPPGR